MPHHAPERPTVDWQLALDTFARMAPATQQVWLGGAAAVLGLVVGLLWLESRYFKHSGRMRSWVVLRLALIEAIWVLISSTEPV